MTALLAAPRAAAALAAGRAAGYCWDERPGGGGSCTRPPLHRGDHMDYYNGRRRITDVIGYTWPQKPAAGRAAATGAVR